MCIRENCILLKKFLFIGAIATPAGAVNGQNMAQFKPYFDGNFPQFEGSFDNGPFVARNPCNFKVFVIPF